MADRMTRSAKSGDTVFDYRGDGLRWKRSVDKAVANVYY